LPPFKHARRKSQVAVDRKGSGIEKVPDRKGSRLEFFTKIEEKADPCSLQFVISS